MSRRCKRCKSTLSLPGLDRGENEKIADRLLSSYDRRSVEACEDAGIAAFICRDVDRYLRGICVHCFYHERFAKQHEEIVERDSEQRAVEAMIAEGAPV